MMLEFFQEGGYTMWVILLSAILSAVLAVRAGLALRRAGGSEAAVGSTIDAVLFWGGFALVTGVLGTAIGISMMARVISEFGGDVSAPLLWGGVRVALTTTIFGGVVCILAGLAWLALRSALLRRRRSLLAGG